MKNLLIITIIIINVSCSKIKYYPDKDSQEVETLILAHRAGGGWASTYQENSMEAAKYALSLVDGIEVDIQLSKDRTIWMSHDGYLPPCGGISYNCFPESTDNQIVSIDSCKGNTIGFTRLETILAYMSEHCPDKYISLDVKAWEPCALSSIGVLGVMNVIADEIIRLTKKYNYQNRVMVESETATFLNYIKKKSSGIDCYLVSFGDFERAMQLALESGYAGISFKYKHKEEIRVEHIQLIRRKGLKIQLWTINDIDKINEALSINPDFIQTDNITYF